MGVRVVVGLQLMLQVAHLLLQLLYLLLQRFEALFGVVVDVGGCLLGHDFPFLRIVASGRQMDNKRFRVARNI